MKTRKNNQRINYYDGQRLQSSDLKADTGFESWLRGVHVRAVHQTWGIALGLELSVDNGQVRIAPGIAYDCHGRELITARPMLVPQPQLPAGKAEAYWYDLVISYDDKLGAELPPSALCFENGRSPLEEQPLWRWRLVEAFQKDIQPLGHGSVRLGEEIPLGRFLISRKKEISDSDAGVRRTVQAQVRPYIASGQAKLTPIYNYFAGNYYLKVDTSAAGFNQAPYYFASLATHPLLGNRSSFGKDELDTIQRTLGPFLSIRDADRKSFTLEVRFATTLVDITGSNQFYNMLADQFTINWTGIEMTRGCPPPPAYVVFLPLFIYAEAVTFVTDNG